MRKLHLVGFTSDRKGLIFSARRGSKSGGFVVALEEGLVETLEAEQRRAAGGDDASQGDDAATGTEHRHRPESTLTPREMQARLRAGRTIAEVAEEAQVDPEWVERFAVPILAEQAQMVELARTLTYNKPRRGPSAEPLGPSVAENLIDRSVVLMDDAFDAAWTANQLHDVVWAVRLRYRSRGRDQEAAWEVNVATGQLTARNRLASALGYVDERQRRAAPRQPGSAEAELPEPDAARPTVAASPTSRKRSRTGAPAAARPASAKGSARRGAGPKAATSAARAAKAGRAAAPTKVTKARATTTAAKARKPTSASKAPRSSKATSAAKSTGASTAKAAGAAATKAKTPRSAPTAKGTPAPRTTTPTRTPRAKKTAKTAKAAKAATSGKAGRAKKATKAKRAVGEHTTTRPAAATGSPSAAVATPPRLRIGTDGSPSSASAGGGRTSATGRSSPGAMADTAEPSRAINRLATTRVAASRAAAGRLSGDRRAANPVPSAVDDLTPPRRSRPAPVQPRADPAPEPLGPPSFMAMPPAAPQPPPPPPPQPPADQAPPHQAPPHQSEPPADDDHFGNVGGPPEPAGLLQFDDLLESVDFDDPAKAYPGPASGRSTIRRSRPGSASTDSSVTRIPRPLSAWPMGAG